MDAKKRYEEWLENPYFDEATKSELKNIAEDEKEIEERFYRDLEFGTGGLRGIIGAGTNRMNIYTVRKATQGLANFIRKEKAEKKGVAIAFDSRNMSPEFAQVLRTCSHFPEDLNAALEGKVNFLIKVLKFIIAESGFELLARIEIKDKKTGRCFR